ncbi:DUF6447 family protein [Modicisalibacter sp. 'Wilcox']|uniref:DUF6447 family protein n=1 Tax=Modicisalibacter sp. 'Wilcox' TaxID=2679914 RepID=UPI0013D816ED|nr:DUF6447 family protein [Modicisalibacter sp. 'Wilcox']
MADSQTVTIDGTQYTLRDLSDRANAHLINLRRTDEEIARLKQRLAMTQTARQAYADALQAALPKQQH